MQHVEIQLSGLFTLALNRPDRSVVERKLDSPCQHEQSAPAGSASDLIRGRALPGSAHTLSLQRMYVPEEMQWSTSPAERPFGIDACSSPILCQLRQYHLSFQFQVCSHGVQDLSAA